MDRTAVTRLMDDRRGASETRALTGTERVDIELEGVGNGPFKVRKKSWEWVVDEPPERGGTDSAPNPLAYFLSGSVSCLLSHYMLCAIEEGIEVSPLKVTARMRFNRAADVSRVTEVIYAIKLGSNADRARVLDLIQRAQAMCYAHNTLAAAGVSMVTDVTLNDEPLAKLEI